MSVICNLTIWTLDTRLSDWLMLTSMPITMPLYFFLSLVFALITLGSLYTWGSREILKMYTLLNDHFRLALAMLSVFKQYLDLITMGKMSAMCNRLHMTWPSLMLSTGKVHAWAPRTTLSQCTRARFTSKMAANVRGPLWPSLQSTSVRSYSVMYALVHKHNSTADG